MMKLPRQRYQELLYRHVETDLRYAQETVAGAIPLGKIGVEKPIGPRVSRGCHHVPQWPRGSAFILGNRGSSNRRAKNMAVHTRS